MTTPIRLATANLALALVVTFAPPPRAQAQPGLDLPHDTLTQSVLIHPPIDVSGDRLFLSTREHTYRSQLRLADQLARDFMVKKISDDGIGRPYRRGTDGTQNEDWFGWRRDVLAPFESTVVRVVEPDTVNAPGTMNREARPGLIVFQDTTETLTVAYAHVREIRVEPGEPVDPGEVVAKMGNNGSSRNPHVHVGAWRGDPDLLGAKNGGMPLQIQVDLYASERPPRR
jgi:hypothetical protein